MTLAELLHLIIYQWIPSQEVNVNEERWFYHNSGRVDSEEWGSASPTVNTVLHLIERI